MNLRHQSYSYNQGTQQINDGCFAYLQPNGSWGWSNAGIIADQGDALLVDTLFDLALTEKMLAAFRGALPDTTISRVINTHANGDHTYGNQLLPACEIISSAAAREEMLHQKPQQMALLKKMAPLMGKSGKFFLHCFGAFNFDGIKQVLPNSTFSGNKALSVGDKSVELIEVGPAHSRGDVLAYSPADRTVFTGDILFVEGHPIMWYGPLSRWLQALDLIMGMDVDTIVPGHGPITDKNGVLCVKEYFEFLYGEARKRYDAGMSSQEAARDIRLDRYEAWHESERMLVNMAVLYKEFASDTREPNVVKLFASMADWA